MSEILTIPTTFHWPFKLYWVITAKHIPRQCTCGTSANDTPLSFPLFCALWEHSSPLSVGIERPLRHHSPLSDNWHKRGLGGPTAAVRPAPPLGRERRKVPCVLGPAPVVVWWKPCQCRLGRSGVHQRWGITLIKAVPRTLDVHPSFNLLILFVTLNQLGDSRSFEDVVMRPNSWWASFF